MAKQDKGGQAPADKAKKGGEGKKADKKDKKGEKKEPSRPAVPPRMRDRYRGEVVPALRNLAEQFERRAGIATYFHARGQTGCRSNPGSGSDHPRLSHSGGQRPALSPGGRHLHHHEAGRGPPAAPPGQEPEGGG